MAKTRRTAPGHYVTLDGRFEIRWALDDREVPTGQWHLLENVDGHPVWWNTFPSKRAALEAALRNS